MTSLEHLALIDLFRDAPVLVPQLLGAALRVALPRRAEAAVVELRARRGRVALAVAVEVQRRRDVRKRRAWLSYLAALWDRRRCPACVLVVTPDPGVARWAARPIEVGPLNAVRVLVLGPQQMPRVTDVAEAARRPELALLSALIHGDREPAVLVAAARALVGLERERAELYWELLGHHLLPDTRTALERIMFKTYKRFSDIPIIQYIDKTRAEAFAEAFEKGLRRGKVRGRAKGRREGRLQGELAGLAEALLAVAAGRRLRLTPVYRRRIAECQDPAQLKEWLARAAVAERPREVFAA